MLVLGCCCSVAQTSMLAKAALLELHCTVHALMGKRVALGCFCSMALRWVQQPLFVGLRFTLHALKAMMLLLSCFWSTALKSTQ